MRYCCWTVWCLFLTSLPAQWRLADCPADPIAASRRMVVQPAPAEGTVLTVVDDTQRPVAAADVFVVALDSVPPADRERLTAAFADFAWLVMAVRGGQRFRADERGVVCVPLPANAMCGAVHPAHGGIGRLHAGARVQLSGAPSTVPVEVYDGDGRPLAGVVVELVVVRPRDESPKRRMGGLSPMRVRMADDGTSTVMVASSITDAGGRARVRLCERTSEGARHRVRAVVLGGEIENDVELVPGGIASIVQMRTGPVASLRMPVVDVAGTEFAFERVWLRHADREVWPVAITGHVAVFAPLAQGEAFTACIRTAHHAERPITMDLPPLTKGEVVEAFRVGADGVVLRGRLLDERGAVVDGVIAIEPLSQCGSVLFEPGGELRRSRFRTDADGRFLWSAPPSVGKKRRFRVLVQNAAGWLGTVVSVAPDAAGVVELGDLRLQPPRSVVVGHVVDPLGEPIAASRVEVNVAAEARTLAMKTRADGSFAFLDVAPVEGAITVRADTSWQQWCEVAAQAGDRDVRLVVKREVQVSLRLQTWMPFEEAFHVDFHQGGKAVEQTAFERGVAVCGVVSGRYDVRLCFAGQLVVWLPGVEVGFERQQLVRTIDWEALLPKARVRVVDDAGKEADVAVQLVADHHVAVMSGPWPRVVPCTPGMKVRVQDRRFRTREFTIGGAPGVQDLVVVPRTTLRLRVPDGLQLPEGIVCEARVGNEVVGSCTWSRKQPNTLAPDGDGPVTLCLFAVDGRDVAFEQLVPLPASGGERDELLTIDARVVAELMAALRGDGGR